MNIFVLLFLSLSRSLFLIYSPIHYVRLAPSRCVVHLCVWREWCAHLNRLYKSYFIIFEPFWPYASLHNHIRWKSTFLIAETETPLSHSQSHPCVLIFTTERYPIRITNSSSQLCFLIYFAVSLCCLCAFGFLSICEPTYCALSLILSLCCLWFWLVYGLQIIIWNVPCFVCGLFFILPILLLLLPSSIFSGLNSNITKYWSNLYKFHVSSLRFRSGLNVSQHFCTNDFYKCRWNQNIE